MVSERLRKKPTANSEEHTLTDESKVQLLGRQRSHYDPNDAAAMELNFHSRGSMSTFILVF